MYGVYDFWVATRVTVHPKQSLLRARVNDLATCNTQTQSSRLQTSLIGEWRLADIVLHKYYPCYNSFLLLRLTKSLTFDDRSSSFLTNASTVFLSIMPRHDRVSNPCNRSEGVWLITEQCLPLILGTNSVLREEWKYTITNKHVRVSKDNVYNQFRIRNNMKQKDYATAQSFDEGKIDFPSTMEEALSRMEWQIFFFFFDCLEEVASPPTTDQGTCPEKKIAMSCDKQQLQQHCSRQIYKRKSTDKSQSFLHVYYPAFEHPQPIFFPPLQHYTFVTGLNDALDAISEVSW